MRKIILGLTMLTLAASAQAQVALDSVGRDAGYVQTILGRSQKIVDGLQLQGDDAKANVLNIIANRYFLLSDIQGKYEDEVKRVKADPALKERQQVLLADLANGMNASLYVHHFELTAALANYLTDRQVEAVKDGLTYGVVPKTYQAYLEMIPSLKSNEKLQILNWLKEAREFAVDAGDSKSKHGWFNKYKGRINNWLSKRGYDISQERKAWGERIAAQKKSK
ncbi:MAG: DUF3826 domain-containing protein [Prevotella sp.]|nr:DUF3826 domain-containing protein [Prevotella sp.]